MWHCFKGWLIGMELVAKINLSINLSAPVKPKSIDKRIGQRNGNVVVWVNVVHLLKSRMIYLQRARISQVDWTKQKKNRTINIKMNEKKIPAAKLWVHIPNVCRNLNQNIWNDFLLLFFLFKMMRLSMSIEVEVEFGYGLSWSWLSELFLMSLNRSPDFERFTIA